MKKGSNGCHLWLQQASCFFSLHILGLVTPKLRIAALLVARSVLPSLSGYSPSRSVSVHDAKGRIPSPPLPPAAGCFIVTNARLLSGYLDHLVHYHRIGQFAGIVVTKPFNVNRCNSWIFVSYSLDYTAKMVSAAPADLCISQELCLSLCMCGCTQRSVISGLCGFGLLDSRHYEERRGDTGALMVSELGSWKEGGRSTELRFQSTCPVQCIQDSRREANCSGSSCATVLVNHCPCCYSDSI